VFQPSCSSITVFPMPSLPRSRWFRIPATTLCAILAITLAILGYQEALRLTGNFHAVVDGQVYRSAQPTPERLRDYISTFGIRTIINLRGSQPGSGWYDREHAVADKTRVEMIDFPMSAGDELSIERANELVAIMKVAQKPILIHCKTGADRTGLAAVIYANRIAGIDEEMAEEQFSPLLGHFGIPLFSPTFAMDLSWEALEKAYGIEGS